MRGGTASCYDTHRPASRPGAPVEGAWSHGLHPDDRHRLDGHGSAGHAARPHRDDGELNVGLHDVSAADGAGADNAVHGASKHPEGTRRAVTDTGPRDGWSVRLVALDVKPGAPSRGRSRRRRAMYGARTPGHGPRTSRRPSGIAPPRGPTCRPGRARTSTSSDPSCGVECVARGPPSTQWPSTERRWRQASMRPWSMAWRL